MEKSFLLSAGKCEIPNVFGQEHSEDSGRSLKFYEESMWELIKARMVLYSSYAYGYYLDQNLNLIVSNKSEIEDELIGVTTNLSILESLKNHQSPSDYPLFALLSSFKSSFEGAQSELEEVTESLAEMIERPYLRTPRRTILQTLQLCRRKRQHFLIETYRGIGSNDNKVKGYIKDDISNNTGIMNDITITRLEKSVHRKPLTQIQSQHVLYPGTLPRKARNRVCHKRSTEDPWLVKENNVNVAKQGDGNYKNDQLDHATHEDLEKSKFSLRMCQETDCGTKFWTKSLQIPDKSYRSQCKEQFCSLKCVKSSEARTAHLKPSLAVSGSLPLEKAKVGTRFDPKTKDVETYSSDKRYLEEDSNCSIS